MARLLLIVLPVVLQAFRDQTSDSVSGFECKEDEVCVVSEIRPCDQDWNFQGIRISTQNPVLVDWIKKEYRRCKPKNVWFLTKMKRMLLDKVPQPVLNDECRSVWSIEVSKNVPGSEEVWHSRDAKDGDTDALVCEELLAKKNFEVCEVFQANSDQYRKCQKRADASRCPWGCVDDYTSARAKKGLV
eukprot:TRINITY_DN8939_c4_g1_i1.p1 TRINITY_DN8939_c4_g1~~TRINITY_DN8939_c4_g1_i1.p1  ORF type:complete len:187 (-),score=35.21 TRINITY_DN8939_c4_g1_i1:148-708(-)